MNKAKKGEEKFYFFELKKSVFQSFFDKKTTLQRVFRLVTDKKIVLEKL
ncbi:hypothetical protein [Flavobacterium sp. LHD-85]|nr:hypothetical protein [Flavobacterium sp. LHD-85]MDQ6530173.1 hypothetical protein [Flavobacterium sp. LHD-85]